MIFTTGIVKDDTAAHIMYILLINDQEIAGRQQQTSVSEARILTSS